MEQSTVQKRQVITNSIEIETRKIMDSELSETARDRSKVIAAAKKQIIWQNIHVFKCPFSYGRCCFVSVLPLLSS